MTLTTLLTSQYLAKILFSAERDAQLIPNSPSDAAFWRVNLVVTY